MHQETNRSNRKRGLNTTEEADDGKSIKRTRTMPEVAGKILCIELENFMCHSTLTVNFNVKTRNCSYIVGPNGSGKSALFASLNIGLGGTGRSNERGKTIQSYIKEGANYAQIRIHLTNEGPNAIQDFDDIIVIERRITDKTSIFNLKSRSSITGKEQLWGKRNVKQELDFILQQFNIELDNPLSWLSQDRARQFLQAMKPERLYELYRKSTEMDSTAILFRNIDSLFEELTKIIESMDKEKKAKQNKYDQKKARFDAINTLKDKKREIQKLYWFKIWAPIRDGQNEISEIHEKLQQNAEKKDKRLELQDQCKKNIERINEEQVQKEQEREKAASKCRDNNDRQNEMKRKIRVLNFDLKDFETKITMEERKIRSIDNEMQQGRRKLQEIMGNSNRDVEGEKVALKAEQNKLTEQIESTGLARQAITTELRPIEEEIQNEKRIYATKYSEYTQFENQRKRLIEDRASFEQSKTDKLALFGPDVPNLLKLINNNRSLFNRMPIGPIGNCIKLLDQKWADPVEYILRGVMGTFLCDSMEDRKTFDELCASNQMRKPQIVTTRFANHRFDISHSEPPQNYVTIARVLDVENPTVFNYLLDKTRAETVVLFEQDDVARREMYPQPPINAHKAMTLACTEVNPERGRRPYTCFRNQFRSRIFANLMMARAQSNFDAQIKEIGQNMQQQSAECKKLKENIQAKTLKMDDLKSKRNQMDVKLDDLNKRRYGIEEELHKLEDIMLSEDRISNIHASIRENEEERTNNLRKLDELRTHHRELQEKIGEQQSKVDANAQVTAHLKNEYNQKEKDIESCTLQRNKIEDKLSKLIPLLEKHLQLEEMYNRQIEQKEATGEKLLTEAEAKRMELIEEGTFDGIIDIENGPPDFSTIPETHDLKEQINMLQREIKTEEENHEDPPTMDDLKTLADEYRKFTTMVKVWRDRYDKIGHMILVHNKRLHMIMSALPQELELHFQGFMNMRNYKGTLTVKDDDGIIDIRVETHKKVYAEEGMPTTMRRGNRHGEANASSDRSMREKRIVQDLKGLSGGERSYTTACFIMALWKCMESPFRCMDEFDVFMDMINRRVIMEMLADLAKESKEIQFFFFTPQPVQELRRDEFEVFTLQRKGDGMFGQGQEMENEGR